MKIYNMNVYLFYILTGNNATNVPAAPFIYENWNAVPGSGVASYPVV